VANPGDDAWAPNDPLVQEFRLDGSLGDDVKDGGGFSGGPDAKVPHAPHRRAFRPLEKAPHFRGRAAETSLVTALKGQGRGKGKMGRRNIPHLGALAIGQRRITRRYKRHSRNTYHGRHTRFGHSRRNFRFGRPQKSLKFGHLYKSHLLKAHFARPYEEMSLIANGKGKGKSKSAANRIGRFANVIGRKIASKIAAKMAVRALDKVTPGLGKALIFNKWSDLHIGRKGPLFNDRDDDFRHDSDDDGSDGADNDDRDSKRRPLP